MKNSPTSSFSYDLPIARGLIPPPLSGKSSKIPSSQINKALPQICKKILNAMVYCHKEFSLQNLTTEKSLEIRKTDLPSSFILYIWIVVIRCMFITRPFHTIAFGRVRRWKQNG